MKTTEEFKKESELLHERLDTLMADARRTAVELLGTFDGRTADDLQEAWSYIEDGDHEGFVEVAVRGARLVGCGDADKVELSISYPADAADRNGCQPFSEDDSGTGGVEDEYSSHLDINWPSILDALVRSRAWREGWPGAQDGSRQDEGMPEYDEEAE